MNTEQLNCGQGREAAVTFDQLWWSLSSGHNWIVLTRAGCSWNPRCQGPLASIGRIQGPMTAYWTTFRGPQMVCSHLGDHWGGPSASEGIKAGGCSEEEILYARGRGCENRYFELADHDGDDCSRHPPVTSISLYEYPHYIVYLVCVFSENENRLWEFCNFVVTLSFLSLLESHLKRQSLVWPCLHIYLYTLFLPLVNYSSALKYSTFIRVLGDCEGL